MMILKEHDRTLRAAIETYGIDAQLNKAVEECNELITELILWNQNRNEKRHLIDEIADVKIMLRQLELIFMVEDEVDRRVEFKVKRLGERIK